MNQKSKKARSNKIIQRSIVLLLACLISIPSKNSLAANKIELNESWEELYVESSDLNAIYDQPYAKFNSTVSDVAEYYLDLSSEELPEPFSAALTKAKVTHTEDTIAPFKASLMQYLYDGDEDEKQVYKPVTVYVPLPSDAQEHPEDCSLYKISGSTASYVSSSLCVDDYDVYYVQLSFSKQADYSTVYGFVFNSPDDYMDEPDDPDDEELPDDADIPDEEIDEFDVPEDETPEGNVLPDPYDEDEDDIEYEDDPINEYDLPEDESIDEDEPEDIPTAEPIQKPVATLAPTQAPSQTGGSSKDTAGSAEKDHIPQTGDDFPLTGMIAAGSISALVLVTALIKKRHE